MADLIPIGYGLAVLPLAFAGVPLLCLAWLVLIALGLGPWALSVIDAAGRCP
jgi:hypothetical protein